MSRMLDPSCGDGAFLSAMQRRFPFAHVSGIEVDASAARAARARVGRAADVIHQDFFETQFGERFDAMLGNPPYVRQERLSPAAKQAASAALVKAWPNARPNFWGRGDLSTAFIWRGISMLRPGGRMGFVVSSALLDAGYAHRMWSALAPFARVRLLLEAPEERWFSDAAVNAMIVVVEREPKDPSVPVTIARLRASSERAAAKVRSWKQLEMVADLRQADPLAPETWAARVRGSNAWFGFCEENQGVLVPLSELADVKRGTTSGANEVFYLAREDAASQQLEKQVLWPLYRSPRQGGGDRISLRGDETPSVALVMPDREDSWTLYPRASAYLAERQGVRERPTLRARMRWWALPHTPARLLLTKSYANRFIQRFADRPIFADQRGYVVLPKEGVDIEMLAASLNSSFTALALESLGRSSLGEGALEWTVADAQLLPVLDPRRLTRAQTALARAAFRKIAGRQIARVDEELAKDDRQTFDLSLLPSMSAKKMGDLYVALANSVERRAQRARAIRD